MTSSRYWQNKKWYNIIVVIVFNLICSECEFSFEGWFDNTKAFNEISRILEAAKKRNLLTGLHNGTPEYAQRMIEKGFNLVTVGSDSRYIASGAKADLEKLKGKKGPKTNAY